MRMTDKYKTTKLQVNGYRIAKCRMLTTQVWVALTRLPRFFFVCTVRRRAFRIAMPRFASKLVCVKRPRQKMRVD